VAEQTTARTTLATTTTNKLHNCLEDDKDDDKLDDDGEPKCNDGNYCEWLANCNTIIKPIGTTNTHPGHNEFPADVLHISFHLAGDVQLMTVQ